MLPFLSEKLLPVGVRSFVRAFLVNEEDPFRMTAVSLPPSREGEREGERERESEGRREGRKETAA